MATVTIVLDTAQEDIASVLAALTGGAQSTPKAAAPVAPAPAKAAAKPAAPKAEEPAADEPAEEKPAAKKGTVDLQEAVARATELVSSGKASQVKEALSSVGAKRVSELTEKTLPGFIEALDAAAA